VPVPSGTRLGLRRSKGLFWSGQLVTIGTGLPQDREGSIPCGTAVDRDLPDRRDVAV